MHPCRIACVSNHIEAAHAAIKINPVNASPAHLALLTTKYWGAKGVHLTVSFLDNPDQATRKKILQHANSWNKTANVIFTEVNTGGQVRITRIKGQGYWSYIGTDILHIPSDQPTMNLESFNASSTPDSEFYRVVRHEFGHTLGFPHEHTRKEIVNRIDREAAQAYFLKYDGWDAETVEEQVLKITPDELVISLPSDVKSTMCYGLPAEIMKDNISVPGGTDIDDEDYTLVAKLYPKTDVIQPTGQLVKVLEIDEAVFIRLEAGFAHTQGAKKALEAARADIETKHKALFES